jgi:hypothetical protein
MSMGDRCKTIYVVLDHIANMEIVPVLSKEKKNPSICGLAYVSLKSADELRTILM